jgi:hypothetical protein
LIAQADFDTVAVNQSVSGSSTDAPWSAVLTAAASPLPPPQPR